MLSQLEYGNKISILRWTEVDLCCVIFLWFLSNEHFSVEITCWQMPVSASLDYEWPSKSGAVLCPYGSVSAGREKWANFVLKKYFLALHCDQTVRLFQLFSTVLKRFCPLHLKNSLVLVLAQFFDQAIFTDFTPKLWFLAIFKTTERKTNPN